VSKKSEIFEKSLPIFGTDFTEKTFANLK